MASKNPSNIDKHISCKLKPRRVDSGMSQKALDKRLAYIFYKSKNMKKIQVGIKHLACLSSLVFSKLISLISLKGTKHPALNTEWRTVPLQNFLILSAAMKL